MLSHQGFETFSVCNCSTLNYRTNIKPSHLIPNERRFSPGWWSADVIHLILHMSSWGKAKRFVSKSEDSFTFLGNVSTEVRFSWSL